MQWHSTYDTKGNMAWKDEKLTKPRHVVNYVLGNYTVHRGLAEVEADTIHYK